MQKTGAGEITCVAVDRPASLPQRQDANHDLLHILGLVQVVSREVVDVLYAERLDGVAGGLAAEWWGGNVRVARLPPRRPRQAPRNSAGASQDPKLP